MSNWKNAALSVLAAGLLSSASVSPAQISINIGAAPACPYGYFDYAPYNCAPYGYYGPDWFAGGVFIGAGPWFHGNHGFYGHVDNRFDPHHGYGGPLPGRGEAAFGGFRGNEARDGQGHIGNAGHAPNNEHSAGFAGHGGPGGGGDHGGGDHGGGGHR
ncbi:hypothetical protein [Acidipila sp. EB88]|uniref:hypothetical protein n=1 Tax=Acidipila sp. EB88 TaxID=2305226 RepID=UPI000F5E2A85|nr:hypothetical protein [Acidipila sp. EB88]RRA47165.1 hypothetical protein D1Y84_01545 [Acidipila sp. EB88]